MCCPFIIITLLMSLLVLLGGFFLLAYAKKEALGKMTKLASYVAIIFGTICFVGGIIASLMCGSCGRGKCERPGMECRKEIKIECHKEMMNGSYCEKNATDNCCKEGKGDCKEAKCEDKEAEHCKKEGKECCKEAAAEEKKI